MTTETTIAINLTREYTAAEFEALENDGNRYELIEGKLVMSPATGDEHGRIIDNIYTYFVLLDPKKKSGRFWITTGVKIGIIKPDGKENVPEPDMAFVAAQRIPRKTKGHLTVVPDLAVEVWSPSELTGKGPVKEALEKIDRYLLAGVKIVWGINPDKQTVEIFYQDTNKPKRTLTINDMLEGEDVIPGFKMPVQALFV